MLFFFAATALSSVTFNSHVIHLSGLPPHDENTYAVMFHGDSCPHCQRLAPTWSRSAEQAAGAAIFADISCDENQTACAETRTLSLPRILLFKNMTIVEYPPYLPQITIKIIEWVSSFLEFTPKAVSRENYTSVVSEKACILFSDKRPMSFAATEKYYNRTDVSFLISQDRELLKELNLPKYPSVYVKNGNEYKQYKGKVNAIPLAQFMDKAFAESKEL
jgi:thiol-disulfide isomerase/thioredoxin